MHKIKAYFSGENSVKGATVILIITLTLSNILGLIRDHFLAQKIPTNLLDTYYAAFRIPDLIFNLLILGAISAAFIPVFTNYIAKKDIKKAWHVTNSFMNLAAIGLIVFILILALLMPYLIPLLVPDFDPEKQALTIQLARLLLISPLFFGISYLFGAVLNSFKRFLVYSIAPLVYNLSIILATIFFADKIGVYAPVLGVIIGAFLHMSVQIPSAIALGWRPKWVFDWAHEGVKKITKLMIPRTIGLGAMQVMLLVYTGIASSIGAGAVAIFNLADNIQSMPTVVFGTSFATAVFPSLSQAASLGKDEDFSNYIWKSIRAILFILIPAGVGIILLRAQIVRLILGSGHFGWQQTIDTAQTLGYFALALFAQGLIPLLARGFYARHNTKTPTIISIISMVVSVILGFILTPKMGVAGLALAFSLSGFFNAALLYIYLQKTFPLLKNGGKGIGLFLLKILAATGLMVLIIQLSKYVVEPLVNMQKFWGVLTQTGVAIALGMGAYLLLAHLLGCKEFTEVFWIIKKRFSPNGNNINKK